MVSTDAGLYIVYDSGCSCYGPGENVDIVIGPTDGDGLLSEAIAEYCTNPSTLQTYGPEIRGLVNLMCREADNDEWYV